MTFKVFLFFENYFFRKIYRSKNFETRKNVGKKRGVFLDLYSMVEFEKVPVVYPIVSYGVLIFVLLSEAVRRTKKDKVRKR